MNKYFQVKVQFSQEDDRGKIKKVTVSYLVDAVSCTEAEARLVKSLGQEGHTRDYEVKSVSESNIVQVIPYS